MVPETSNFSNAIIHVFLCSSTSGALVARTLVLRNDDDPEKNYDTSLSGDRFTPELVYTRMFPKSLIAILKRKSLKRKS